MNHAEPSTASAAAADKGPTLLALERVAELCAAGDAEKAIETLMASGYPARVVGRLAVYDRVPLETRRDAVAEAVAAVHAAVVAGRPVAHPGGYLFKVADTICAREQRLQETQRSVDALTDYQVLDVQEPWADVESGTFRDRRRSAALRLAREMLPRLGQQVAQQVMGYLFDAVERGDRHVPSQQIAAALELSDDVVRASLSRGFKRLTRLATERGLDVRAADLLDDPDFDPDDPDDLEDPS